MQRTGRVSGLSDEKVPAAKSGWRPRVNASVTAQREWSPITANLPSDAESSLDSPTSNCTQPVLSGLPNNVEGIKSAKGRLLRRGVSSYSRTEQDVLFRCSLDAYLSVIRFRQVLSIQPAECQPIFKSRPEQPKSRFEVGEVTRTDVSQARARVSQAQGDGRLNQSRILKPASLLTCCSCRVKTGQTEI